MMMLKESRDQEISDRPPDVRTAREWKVEVATEEIISSLEHGDIVDQHSLTDWDLAMVTSDLLGKCLNGTEKKLQ